MKTATEFLTAIESYYDLKYVNLLELKILSALIADRVKPESLNSFFDAVTTHHSKKWKSLPDKEIYLTVISKFTNTALQIKADESWRGLLRVSDSWDIMITDPITYYVVSGFGSWYNFCEQRDGEYRELVRKEFIKQYINAVENKIEVTPVKLFGAYTTLYGQSFIQPRITVIGNHDEAKKLLDKKSPVEITFLQNISDDK
jgi:hypothetical protein